MCAYEALSYLHEGSTGRTTYTPPTLRVVQHEPIEIQILIKFLREQISINIACQSHEMLSAYLSPVTSRL